MINKFLFLDFDGVLNGATNGIEKDKIELLNQIVKETECTVVISSTWRIIHEKEELLGLMHAAGYLYNFAGYTPNMGCNLHFINGWKHEQSHRGHEIQQWLIDNKISMLPTEDNRIVILDDSSDMEPLMDHLVRTNTYIGLESKHVDEIIKRFNNVV